MSIRLDAWEEVRDDARRLLALAGHTTRAEFLADRVRRARQVVELCRVTSEMRGFEIGSGDGTVASILAPLCGALDCTDASRTFLNTARRRCRRFPNVSFQEVGTDYLAFLPEASYDFGYGLAVFIHLNTYDVYHYLCDARRILKPGGRFMFDACDLGPGTAEVFREHAAMYRADPACIRGLHNFNSASALQFLAREAGLEVCPESIVTDVGWMTLVVSY